MNILYYRPWYFHVHNNLFRKERINMSDDRIFSGVGPSQGASAAAAATTKCCPSTPACGGVGPFSGGFDFLLIILLIFLLFYLLGFGGFGGFALAN